MSLSKLVSPPPRLNVRFIAAAGRLHSGPVVWKKSHSFSTYISAFDITLPLPSLELIRHFVWIISAVMTGILYSYDYHNICYAGLPAQTRLSRSWKIQDSLYKLCRYGHYLEVIINSMDASIVLLQRFPTVFIGLFTADLNFFLQALPPFHSWFYTQT